MAFRVMYNGCESKPYYGCTKPNKLIAGKEYIVEGVINLGRQTNYILKGIPGQFSAEWFDDVYCYDRIYMALSYTTPLVGRRCCLYVIEVFEKNPELLGRCTSVVTSVNHLGNNIYNVNTVNNVTFLVKVAD